MKDFDGNSLNVIWEGVRLSGHCEVCGEAAAFEIEEAQRSSVMKHLFFKMVEKQEYGHAHEEVPDAGQE